MLPYRLVIPERVTFNGTVMDLQYRVLIRLPILPTKLLQVLTSHYSVLQPVVVANALRNRQ